MKIGKGTNMDKINVVIPQSVENLALPDDSLLNFYEGIDQRMFWITDEISIYSLNLIHYILKWNQEDRAKKVEDCQPIKLFFFSPGGDLDINYALIDTIKLSRTPIIGINIGQCASAAAYIYLSCPRRLMLPHAYFLFHQGSGVMSGTYGEICAQMDDYSAQVEELTSFMVKHTKYTAEEVMNKIVGEWYVRKSEALEKGVADGIVESLEDIY